MHHSAPVATASTVLSEEDFHRFSGLRAGFIGNHTSRLDNGKSTLQAILDSGSCNVDRLFAPEHGAFGTYDEDVDDENDPSTGLKIYSLFGAHRSPSPEMLDGLDCLIFELQDVGARFYTFTATLLLAIDAAWKAGIKVVVLDRLNPIGGHIFEGPIADKSARSFVAPYDIPIRHGLTLGELAVLYAQESGHSECVEVVQLRGWARTMYFDESGVPWVRPSPAMKSLSTALVYPGVCLLEQTNVSVGRGTDSPFEIVGAPYVDGDAFAELISDMRMPGVEVAGRRFTPTSSKFAGEECSGLDIVVTDREAFRPVQLGLSLIAGLRALCRRSFEIDGIKNLLASEELYGMISAGHNSEELAVFLSPQLVKWQERIKPCLLY